MALSMLHEIDQKYPGAEITWICGKIIAPLITSFERINKVVIVDDYKLLKGNFLNRLSVIFSVWSKLAFKKFDLVINAYRNKSYVLFTLTAFKSELKSFGGNDRKNQMVLGRYHASEYARLIHEIDDWKIPEPVIPKINPPVSTEIKSVIEKIGSPKIILTPGGAQNLINGGAQRRWPAEHYYLLTKALLQKFKSCSIILAGSKEDEWASNSFNDLPVINLIGKTSLISLLYLYKQCDLLVTHDTGLLHLAKLTDINAVALFGPVNPVERIGTNENIESIWLGNDLSCSPCYNGKSFSDCSNNICMKNISVEMVLNKIETTLKKSANK